MSESFEAAIFLTLSGGFQDAYTYCCRDKVFANAQTGNILIMSSHFFEGEVALALPYLVPIFCFVAGIFTSSFVHRRYKNITWVHWRQLILLSEIILLFCVGFIPHNLNMLANSLVSFVCAMQIQAFPKVGSNNYASTMCIGNLRNGTDALCAYICTKDKALLKKSRLYFSVIFIFALGAGIGSIFTEILGLRAIHLSCILLFVSFLLMFIKDDVKELKEDAEKLLAQRQRV